MPALIALLRGVNVGGNKLVSMAGLRSMLDELGFPGARTLLQSGNLIFESRRKPAALESLLQREANERLGLDCLFYVRSALEWRQAIAANPFPAAARDHPGRLLLLTLKTAPASGALKQLRASYDGPESIELRGRAAYIIYPDGMGRSRLTMSLLDKTLGRGTGRNWNTVLKIGAMLEE